MLLLGYEVRIPAELRSGHVGDSEDISIKSYGEYVSWLRERLQTAHDIACEHLGKCSKAT